MESLYAIDEGIKRVCACTPVRYIITTAEKVKVHTFQIAAIKSSFRLS